MRTRAILLWQARWCELGGEVRCLCRCAGRFHGARRFGPTVTAADLASLPPDDPHYRAARPAELAPRLPFSEEARAW